MDCSTGEGATIRGTFARQFDTQRPFQIVSMDFVTDLPETERGNKMLLFGCVQRVRDGPSMSTTTAESVLKRSTHVFQRFGACDPTTSIKIQE
jgi:hypothetical protein